MNLVDDLILDLRHAASWNVDALEEVPAFHSRLLEIPPGGEVGLGWEGETLGGALEAGLDALVFRWTAARGADWDQLLCLTGHLDVSLVLVAWHRQLRLRHARLVSDGSDMSVAASVRRDEAVFNDTEEISVVRFKVCDRVVEVVALVLVEVAAQTAQLSLQHAHRRRLDGDSLAFNVNEYCHPEFLGDDLDDP